MLPALADAVADAIALIFPTRCAGCGRDDRELCRSCAAQLAPDPIRRVLPSGVAVCSALAYAGVARSVLLEFKEQGRTPLARFLAPALAVAVDAAAASVSLDGVELCAVPSSRSAFRRRGFDPVGVLLDRAGLRSARVFAPARPHAAQKSLGELDRQANLADAFRLRRSVDGRRFLLVDDIVTTGSTLDAAVGALRDGGAEVVAAASVAATERRRPARPQVVAGARGSPR